VSVVPQPRCRISTHVKVGDRVLAYAEGREAERLELERTPPWWIECSPLLRKDYMRGRRDARARGV